jgi:hypothetical protein
VLAGQSRVEVVRRRFQSLGGCRVLLLVEPHEPVGERDVEAGPGRRDAGGIHRRLDAVGPDGGHRPRGRVEVGQGEDAAGALVDDGSAVEPVGECARQVLVGGQRGAVETRRQPRGLPGGRGRISSGSRAGESGDRRVVDRPLGRRQVGGRQAAGPDPQQRHVRRRGGLVQERGRDGILLLRAEQDDLIAFAGDGDAVLDPLVAVLEVLVQRRVRRMCGAGRGVTGRQVRADLLDEEPVGGRDGDRVQVLLELPVERRHHAVPGQEHAGGRPLGHLVGPLVDDHVPGGVVDVGDGHVRHHLDADEGGLQAQQLGVHRGRLVAGRSRLGGRHHGEDRSES